MRYGLSERIPETAGGHASHERLNKAGEMLDDGASPAEVYKTLGVCVQTLRRHFPESFWTNKQKGDYAVMVKKLNGLPLTLARAA